MSWHVDAVRAAAARLTNWETINSVNRKREIGHTWIATHLGD
jgi:hypothetical protein